MWATFPKPILAIICSGGQKPGELKSINTKANKGLIDSFIINASSDVRELLPLVQQGGKYKTVVLDHASGLQDLVMKEVLGLEEIPVQKTFGIANQATWGQIGVMTKEYLRAILNLSGNIVIVAQERNFSDDNANEMIAPTVGPALSPGTTGWLNAAVDYIGQTFIRQKYVEKPMVAMAGQPPTMIRTPIKGQVDYCLRSGPDPVFTTKFRVPRDFVTPELIVDASYEKIMSIIDGTYSEQLP